MNNQQPRRSGAAPACSTASKEQADRHQPIHRRTHDLSASPASISSNKKKSNPHGIVPDLPRDAHPKRHVDKYQTKTGKAFTCESDFYQYHSTIDHRGAQAFRIDGKHLDGAGAWANEQPMYYSSPCNVPHYPTELDLYPAHGASSVEEDFEIERLVDPHPPTKHGGLSETMQIYLGDRSKGSDSLIYYFDQANAL